MFPLANAFKAAEALEAEKKKREVERAAWSKGEQVEVDGDAEYEPLL